MNKWKKESDNHFVEEHSQQKTFFSSDLVPKSGYFSINFNERDEMGVCCESGLCFEKDEDGEIRIGYKHNDNPDYPSIRYDPEEKTLCIILEIDEDTGARKALTFDLTRNIMVYALDDSEGGYYSFVVNNGFDPSITIKDEFEFLEVSTPSFDPFLREVFQKPLRVDHSLRIRDFQSEDYFYRSENNETISECSGPNRYGVGVIDSSGKYGWCEYYAICEFFDNKKIEGWHLTHSDDEDSIFWTNQDGKSELNIDIWRSDDDLYLSVYFNAKNGSPLVKYEGPSGYLYIGQSDDKFFHKFKGPGLRFDMANGEVLYLNFESNASAKFVKRVRFDEDTKTDITSIKKSYYASNKANFTNYIKEHPEHFKKK